jgi:hypothetical protein
LFLLAGKKRDVAQARKEARVGAGAYRGGSNASCARIHTAEK